MKLNTEQRAVLQHVFVPIPNDEFLSPIFGVGERLAAQYGGLASSFLANVSAVLAVAGMPFQIANSGICNQRYQQHLIAERIRSGDEDSTSAARIARQKFNDELATEEGTNYVASSVLQWLERLLDDNPFNSAAAELMRQCAVLTWAALEVLATDLFRAFLNATPSRAVRFLEDERTKKYYLAKELGRLLPEYGFNLSNRMGDALLEQRKLDDWDSLRCGYETLFPESKELGTLLGSSALRLLNQDRNLIVHRRSRIDKQYNDKTGRNLPIGSELQITPKEFEEYLTVVRDMTRASSCDPNSQSHSTDE